MALPDLDLRPEKIHSFVLSELPASISAQRYFDYVRTGRFRDDNGEEYNAGRLIVIEAQANAQFYLIRTTLAEETVETGFGAGGSAVAMIAAKHDFKKKMHTSIDPATNIEKNLVMRHLLAKHGSEFRHINAFSEIALPKLAAEHGKTLRFGFIDGGHHFDTALIDFVYFDRMLALGGCIMIDDVNAPAIETACNYIKTNRPDYEWYDTVQNSIIFRKIAGFDARKWDHFTPFDVPNRRDWDCRIPGK